MKRNKYHFAVHRAFFAGDPKPIWLNSTRSVCTTLSIARLVYSELKWKNCTHKHIAHSYMCTAYLVISDDQTCRKRSSVYWIWWAFHVYVPKGLHAHFSLFVNEFLCRIYLLFTFSDHTTNIIVHPSVMIHFVMYVNLSHVLKMETNASCVYISFYVKKNKLFTSVYISINLCPMFGFVQLHFK